MLERGHVALGQGKSCLADAIHQKGGSCVPLAAKLSSQKEHLQHTPQHSGLQDFPNLARVAQNERQNQVRLFQFPYPCHPAHHFLVVDFCNLPLSIGFWFVLSSMHLWPQTQFLWKLKYQYPVVMYICESWAITKAQL